MTDHTPGPWQYTASCPEEGYHCYWITACPAPNQETEIATVAAGSQTSEANARLIAASPDLLAALRDMLAGWRYIREVHGDLYGVGWDRAQSAAEAALAKLWELDHDHDKS